VKLPPASRGTAHFYDPMMVPEAPLEQTEDGLLPNDANVAYGRFPERVPTRYRDGWLPG
jgi:hypothetical protein